MHKIEPSENGIRELLITCVKRGSTDVSFAILNDLKAQNRTIKPSAFRIVFDMAQVHLDIAIADRVKNRLPVVLFLFLFLF